MKARWVLLQQSAHTGERLRPVWERLMRARVARLWLLPCLASLMRCRVSALVTSPLFQGARPYI